MADDKPTTWSLSNQTIGNKETQVDKRLTTITPQNTTGFVPLNPNSNDRLVKELEYSIRTDGIIVYRVPSLDNRQFNNIQQIADAGFPGYNVATTLKIKNELTKVLREETDNKILKGTGISPFAQIPTPAAAVPGSDPLLTSTEAEINFQIETKGVRTQYGDMIYPYDLRSQEQKQDVVKFTMVSYGSRKIEGLRLTQREFNKDKNEEKRINGSVILGIQPRISDNNTVRWNEQGMDVFGIGAAGASLGIIKEGFEGGKKSIEQIGKAFQQEGSNVSGALKIYFAQEAAKTQNLLSRLTGGILNPNIELLFESPELRTFNYNFQLSPREPKEAQEIKKIIRFFKQGMAVQRSEAELFLKAPNVFEIKYLLSNGERDHPYLNKIKKCALVNCGVDYTPTGSYITFAGEENSMVSYNLTLTFKELEPIYANDYDKTYDEIGY